MDELEPIEEERESKSRKVMLILLSLFLIFLIVSLSLTASVGEIIISLVESATIEDGLVEQEVTVHFENESYDILVSLYNENLAQEFKVCLFGYYDGEYFVEEVYEPVIYEQAYDHVISEPCPDYTLIALHSHPYRHCTASAQDLSNLAVAQEVNPNALIGIMCEDDRFHFYG